MLTPLHLINRRSGFRRILWVTAIGKLEVLVLGWVRPIKVFRRMILLCRWRGLLALVGFKET
jgi:hypothetical protein